MAKTSLNPHFQSKYADLSSIVEMAAPILAKHGLSVIQAPETEWTQDGTIPVDVLTTTVMHESGQFFQFTTPIYATKKDAQGYGSGVTYARRYAYSAALSIVADVDDDGNAASTPQPQSSYRPAPKYTPDDIARKKAEIAAAKAQTSTYHRVGG